MTTVTLADQLPDADLWQRVCQGQVSAFEALVGRYQGLVCATAYAICGDRVLSEDVAQETFWAAWRERAALADPHRLRAWLCGIARNLGRNAVRRTAPSAPLDGAIDVPAPGLDPGDEAAAREQEALVRRTLDALPETYREPLVLYYRGEQSVAEVAEALELTEDAVKQRLARGRGMLRDRLAEVVEGALRRSRPGKAFTASVVAGLTAGPAFAAGAAPTTGVAAALASGLPAGVVGGLAGGALGLAGGWLGSWLPAQLAPTVAERDLLSRSGRRMFLILLLFAATLAGLIFFGGWQNTLPGWLAYWAAWMVAFAGYVIFESVRTTRAVRRLRASATGNEAPNPSPVRARALAVASRWRGRVYRSRATLLGLPLVDVNVSDPTPPTGGSPPERRVARGWVAIGDDARGVLLAIGSVARGAIAFGGRTIGLVSVGGMACGVVALGGLSLGVIGVGGVGLGAWAFGGLAVGWQALGGGAIGWDLAVGGGAVAQRAAHGGGAWAQEYAVGGSASAQHANDALAREVVMGEPMIGYMQWYMEHSTIGLVVLLLLGLLPGLLLPLVMYRRS